QSGAEPPLDSAPIVVGLTTTKIDHASIGTRTRALELAYSRLTPCVLRDFAIQHAAICAARKMRAPLGEMRIHIAKSPRVIGHCMSFVAARQRKCRGPTIAWTVGPRAC